MGFTRWTTAHHIRASLVGARRHGVDVAPLLKQAGIEPEVLFDEQGRVTGAQFVALMRALWDALDDEFVGLGAAPLRVGTFAMMAHAIMHSSPDLRTAVRRADRFYRLFPAAPRFTLIEKDAVARVEFDLSAYDDPDRFVAESVLVYWHRSASWFIRRRIGLHEVELGYPAPPHALEYGLLFGTDCRFDAPVTAITFDRALLDRPVAQDEAALRAFLRRLPLDVLARMDYGSEVSAQVRRLLNKAVGDATVVGLPGPEQVAASLSIRPQTLRRKLAAEQTSFQQVRDQLRRDVAVSALARGDASIEKLSERLGFSEPSAFHRAFRRWTGATPRAYQGSYQEPGRSTGTA
jgi:AraC-like DNA-binding protein